MALTVGVAILQGTLGFDIAGFTFAGLNVAYAETASPQPDFETIPASTPEADAAVTLREPVTPSDPLPGSNYSNLLLQGILLKTEVLPIDLDSVLGMVEEQNLALLEQKQGRAIARTQVLQAFSELLPNVAGSFERSETTAVIQFLPGGGTVEFSTYRPQVTFQYKLHPNLLLNGWMAHRLSQANKSLVKETHQQQLARAAESYYQLVEARQAREIALKAIQSAKKQVVLNESRQYVGVGTKLETLQAKTILAQQEQALLEAEQAIAQAEEDLLVRLNMDRGVELHPNTESLVPTALVPSGVSTNALVAYATHKNPVVERLEYEAKAIKAELLSIASDVIPDITLNANVYRLGPDPANMTTGSFRGFTIESTLFEKMGTKLPLRFIEKRQTLKQKKIQIDRIRREVEQQVMNAQLNSETERQKIGYAKTENELADESHRLALGRYKAGLAIQLEVLDAETKRVSAESKIIQAISQYNRAQVRLLETLGCITPETILKGISDQPNQKRSSPCTVQALQQATVKYAE